MLFTRAGNSLCTFVVFLCVACTSGTKPSVKKEYLQIFYGEGVTEAKANQTLDFLYPLWRNDGAETVNKTVELTRSADTFNFRMVVLPDRVSSITGETIGSFIQLMSDTLFDDSPVNVVLCDDHFKEQKTIRYSEEIRNRPTDRIADNEARFGKRFSAGTAEVYLAPGVDEAFGNKMATYLDESDGKGTIQASFRLLQDADGYIVKMATNAKTAQQQPASVFVNMANMLSKDIFSGAPIRFVLTDLLFNDVREFRSEP